MSSYESSAARTNLTSQQVQLHRNQVIGEGVFRIAYAGTYIGGNRNQQEAVCKCFRQKYKPIKTEFFEADDRVTDKAIQFAEHWNVFCASDEEILVTKGDVKVIGGTKYLVEPLIRDFTKFTSNNGWIADSDNDWTVQAMEAFSHFSYHHSGGQMIVCDLQGRHRYDRFSGRRSRFELTDPAVCSRRRNYGPTDLGEKGIESFFANHECNQFCNQNGERWHCPRETRQWFYASRKTSMLGSSARDYLNTQNQARFNRNLEPIMDVDSDDDSW
jgi:hypothetical protein